MGVAAPNDRIGRSLARSGHARVSLCGGARPEASVVRERWPARLLARSRSPIVQYGVLVAFITFVWWGRAADLDLLYASYGFSPMSYVYKSCHPASFASDFPSGVENVSKSAAMYVYPLAYSSLGISPERMFPVYLAFELALIAATMIALTRVLRPQAPRIVSILVAVLVIASDARDMNFAFFAQPFFWAKYYNVADALRILAIVMILKGRPVLSAALLTGSFVSHPTLGLMGGVFVVACFARKPREMLQRGHVAGAMLFLVLAGAWTLGVVGFGRTPGVEFPSKLWFDLTRLTSHHWYPVANGLLTFNHQEGFIQFLSFLILLAFYLSRSTRLRDVDRKAACGIFAMLLLVTLGLAHSVLAVSPTLIKLAFQRGNDLVLTVGLVYIVAGLWSELESGPAWRQLVAATVLVSPFFLDPGFPLLFSILLAAPAWLSPVRPRGNLLVAALLGVSVLLMTYYAATGIMGPLASEAYTALRWLAWLPVLSGIVVLSVALLIHKRTGRRLTRAVVLAAFACAAVLWTARSRLSEQGRVWCRNFKDAQVWARENTPEDALFMVDPVIRYPGLGSGWRDYSRRSSFGNLREWLYTSWCYASDYRLCQEGLKRLGEFDIDVNEYLGYRPPLARFAPLSRELQRRYYSASDQWRLDLARRYHIDFFVSKKLGSIATSKLPIAYENAQFVIHRAERK